MKFENLAQLIEAGNEPYVPADSMDGNKCDQALVFIRGNPNAVADFLTTAEDVILLVNLIYRSKAFFFGLDRRMQLLGKFFQGARLEKIASLFTSAEQIIALAKVEAELIAFQSGSHFYRHDVCVTLLIRHHFDSISCLFTRVDQLMALASLNDFAITILVNKASKSFADLFTTAEQMIEFANIPGNSRAVSELVSNDPEKIASLFASDNQCAELMKTHNGHYVANALSKKAALSQQKGRLTELAGTLFKHEKEIQGQILLARQARPNNL